jgi:hypothetical protein
LLHYGIWEVLEMGKRRLSSNKGPTFYKGGHEVGRCISVSVGSVSIGTGKAQRRSRLAGCHNPDRRPEQT